ncbi:MAG: hypothetical protein RLY50_1379 [Actinomycetota bacterium]
MTVRVGVIGTGMMGCEHLRNVAAVPHARVTAFSDPNEEPRGWARLTLDGAEAAEFVDHRDLLSSGLVDAIIVASPNHTHRALLDDILATDIPVLVEKPMCTTVDDCLAVVDAQSRRSAMTWVGLEYRYMAPIAGLLAEVAAGSAGRVHMVSVREHRFPFLVKVDNWNRFTRNTGGTLVEKCCHFFDLMNMVVRTDAVRRGDVVPRPVRVLASGAQSVNHLDEWHDGQRSDILDNAYVIVEYSDASRAMLDLSMFAEAGRHEQELAVVGDAGKIEAQVPGPGRISVGTRTTRALREIETPVAPEVGYLGAHFGASFVEVSRFCDAVESGGEAEVGVDDGLWSVAIGAAAHRSIDEGRPVLLSEYGLS